MLIYKVVDNGLENSMYRGRSDGIGYQLKELKATPNSRDLRQVNRIDATESFMSNVTARGSMTHSYQDGKMGRKDELLLNVQLWC